ncbi:MAG: hypothetical protein ACK55Z_19585 [bacterium]
MDLEPLGRVQHLRLVCHRAGQVECGHRLLVPDDDFERVAPGLLDVLGRLAVAVFGEVLQRLGEEGMLRSRIMHGLYMCEDFLA